MVNSSHRGNNMALLENEVVRLRALEPEDLELLYRWENNPELWKLGNTMSPYSRYILKEYIRESHRDIYDTKQLRLIIELCQTGTAIGTIDLYDFEPHHRRAGIGILLDPLYQGNGFATQAMSLLSDYVFSFLKLHQLYVHIPVDNEPSRALFERCEFVVSGIMKEWIITEKGYSDVVIMQKVK